MRSALLTGLTRVSIVLGLLVLLLWMHGHWVADTLAWRTPTQGWQVESADGIIAVYWAPVKIMSYQRVQWLTTLIAAPHRRWFPPFLYAHQTYPAGLVNSFGLPSWVLLIAFLFIPSAQLFLNQREQTIRLRAGLCRICGYDLRASTERCPECGTPISPSPREGRGQG